MDTEGSALTAEKSVQQTEARQTKELPSLGQLKQNM